MEQHVCVEEGELSLSKDDDDTSRLIDLLTCGAFERLARQ